MISKEEIDCCKQEAKEYIEFMETAGDNAGWTRLLLVYIEQIEQDNIALKKGQYSLMQSRQKWKIRYYKERKRRKEADKSIEQLYGDYNDAGNKMFEYAERVEQLETKEQKLIEKLEGLYSKLQKEHDIAIDNFIKKDIPFCAEDGAISQEVDFIIGQLEETLKGEKE